MAMTVEVLGAVVHVVERGSGPPVVFLHGNPDSADVWEPVIDRLAGGFRCLAPDLPGFGRSTPMPAPDYSPAGHARLVRELLDALELREPVALVGHDFGGITACAFAAQHGDRLRALGIMDCFFQSDYTWHPWARIWRMPLLGELAMASMNRPLFVRELRRGAPGLSAEYARNAYRLVTPTMKRTVLQMYRALDPKLLADGWEQRLLQTTSRVPTIVIWGEHDPYIAAAYAERFGGAVHRLDCGHWVQMEKPNEVARLLGGFLGGVGPAGAPQPG
jgi:pimeloyl-ACP methyl ester carboxylesterase